MDSASLVGAYSANGGTAKLDHDGQIEFGRPTTTAAKLDHNSASSPVLDDSGAARLALLARAKDRSRGSQIPVREQRSRVWSPACSGWCNSNTARARSPPCQVVSGSAFALARAIAVEPEVLLFDEALSALDRKLREEMHGELRRLLRKIGATAIFVTHDQDEALTMSDRVAVMNCGRIEQVADPVTLYSRPTSLFALSFVGMSTQIAGTVVATHNGLVEVETRLGKLTADGHFCSGSPVVVAVRPEHIQPTDKNVDGNVATGVVRWTTFHGSRLRVEVEANGVRRPSPKHSPFRRLRVNRDSGGTEIVRVAKAPESRSARGRRLCHTGVDRSYRPLRVAAGFAIRRQSARSKRPRARYL
jgi:energy-coupling factor transporter ATP-binding protein EcfA2